MLDLISTKQLLNDNSVHFMVKTSVYEKRISNAAYFELRIALTRLNTTL